MKSKTRLERTEKAARAMERTAPRTFFCVIDETTNHIVSDDEPTGMILETEEQITLAEWRKIRREMDMEKIVRFVNEKPAAPVGIDAGNP